MSLSQPTFLQSYSHCQNQFKFRCSLSLSQPTITKVGRRNEQSNVINNNQSLGVTKNAIHNFGAQRKQNKSIKGINIITIAYMFLQQCKVTFIHISIMLSSATTLSRHFLSLAYTWCHVNVCIEYILNEMCMLMSLSHTHSA